MDTLSYKTRSAKKEDIQREWFIVDAEGQTLGRMCSQIAAILRGKNKPTYTPHVDTGDHVIVINAEKIELSGNKWNDKEYLHYTGYPGGQRSITPKDLIVKKPTMMVEKSVRGMLPKTKLGRAMIKKLHIYAGAEHNHAAQKPKEIKF